MVLPVLSPAFDNRYMVPSATLPAYSKLQWDVDAAHGFTCYAETPRNMADILAVCNRIALKAGEDEVSDEAEKNRKISKDEIRIKESQLTYRSDPYSMGGDLSFTQMLTYESVDHQVGRVYMCPGADDVN